MIRRALFYFLPDFGGESRLAASEAPGLPFSDFPADVMERIEMEEARGKWTGERLASQKPEIYEAVVRMLAAELPVESIAFFCKVSENTVRGIREREPVAIEGQKKRVLGKMSAARERLIERVIETAPAMKGSEAAVAFGIISDKLAMETGAPTQRLEITVARGVEDYQKFVEGLIDVQAEVTGLGEGVRGQRGLGFGGDAGASGRVGEWESPACLRIVDGVTSNVTTDGDRESGTGDQGEQAGGEGGQGQGVGRPNADWLGSREIGAKDSSPTSTTADINTPENCGQKNGAGDAEGAQEKKEGGGSVAGEGEAAQQDGDPASTSDSNQNTTHP